MFNARQCTMLEMLPHLKIFYLNSSYDIFMTYIQAKWIGTKDYVLLHQHSTYVCRLTFSKQ